MPLARSPQIEQRCLDPLNGWFGGYWLCFPLADPPLPLPIPRILFAFVAGGVVVRGPLSVDEDDAFEGDGDWSLIWLNVHIEPLPLPMELSGLLGPLLLRDCIGEKVFAPRTGMGDVLWWFKLLWLLLLLLLFVLLLLLLQFKSEMSGLRSGGDKGPICPNNDESMPEKTEVKKRSEINYHEKLYVIKN